MPHVPGHPRNNLPELPGIRWSKSSGMGTLVRRRTWQRERRKRQLRIRKADGVNPFICITAQPTFIARFTANNGDVLSVWRPRVLGSSLIMGDVVTKGNLPPDKMTAVDHAKVLNSRSENFRESVKRVTLFRPVWNNGKVYAIQCNHGPRQMLLSPFE